MAAEIDTRGLCHPRGLLHITSDRAPADRYLAGRPEQLVRDGIASGLLSWLARHGGLTARQHAQLRSLFGQWESVVALWRREGPAAATELLELVPELWDRFVASRHRAGLRIGDDDATMRADETLLAARQRIAG